MNSNNSSAPGCPQDFLFGIATAIAVGQGDRKAASISRASHEARLMDADRLRELIPIRTASILGSIAEKVHLATALTMTWENLAVTPVMELTAEEYPGPMPRSPYSLPRDRLDPAKLQLAAAVVYEYLRQSGLDPRLDYVYNGDIRRYSLQIVLHIPC